MRDEWKINTDGVMSLPGQNHLVSLVYGGLLREEPTEKITWTVSHAGLQTYGITLLTLDSSYSFPDAISYCEDLLTKLDEEQ